jgi:hypothetical protein
MVEMKIIALSLLILITTMTIFRQVQICFVLSYTNLFVAQQ